MPPMSVELTREQQEALDHQGRSPQRVVDPRTHTAYVLVPEEEYAMLRELLEDDQREQAIHAVALRNAADRLDEIP
jgi:PHD/YefM family antitoxin component YafN of YafNO toxin-antitoxin module